MPLSEASWKEIKKHPLLRDFTNEEYAILSECWEEKIYPKNEMIVFAGQISQELHLIGNGAASYVKTSSYDPNRKTTYLLHSQDLFGEFSFIYSSPQLYDVKTLEEDTAIYSLSRLKLLQQEHSSAIYDKLLFNLVRMELDGSRQSPTILEQTHLSKMLPKKGGSLQTLKREFLRVWLPKEFIIQEQHDIEELMDTKGFKVGEDCIKQNDVLNRFYLLVEGQLEVLEWDEAKHLQVLVDLIEAGDSFGENCLLKPTPAPYTIRARRPSIVLVLDRAQLEKPTVAATSRKLLLHLAQCQEKESPDFIKKSYRYAASAPIEFTSQEARLQFLRNSYLTEELTAEEIAQLNNMLELQEYKSGEVIIHENEMSRDLYFLLRGQLILLKWNEARANYIVINKLQPGEIFGEFAFVNGMPRSVTIKTLTNTQVLCLPFNKFSEQALQKRELYLKLLTNAARLMQQRLQSGKDKEMAHLNVEIHQLKQQKKLWILCFGGLILIFIEPFKSWNPAVGIGLSILQLIGPIWGIRKLKESLSDWGLSKRWIAPSIVQAIVVIAVMGGIYGIFRPFEGIFTFHAPRLLSHHDFSQLSMTSLFSYLLYVVIEEWLKRGIVLSALQRILDDPKGKWSPLLSACLYLGSSLFYSPLLTLAFFLKDLILAYLFVRAPHLIGVILIHFTLGILFALLGWFSL